ncbi:MAG: class I SAM-dependent methyltransferase [Candidatus Zixiibacteriota bacterium]
MKDISSIATPSLANIARPAPFELTLPYGDYRFSQRLYEVVHDWGIPTELEVSFLRRYLPPTGGKVLDLACGAGRHSVGLALLGHTVTGVDIGGFTIDLARHYARFQKVAVDFQVGDIRSMPLPAECDLAFFICGQMAHLSPEDNQAVFRKVFGALRSDGALVIHLERLEPEDRLNRTFWYREIKPLYFENPSLVHREQYYFPTEQVKLIRDFAIDSVTKASGLFGYSEKEYAPEEIERLASRSGFKIISLHGHYDGAPPTADSRYNIFVLKKR